MQLLWNCDKTIEQQEEGTYVEGKIRDLEELYKLITESANDFIAVTDLDLQYEYVNNAFKRVMGHTDDDFIGKNRNDLVHPEDIEEALEKLDLLLKDGEATIILRVKKKDNKYAWMELNGKKFKTSKQEEKILLIGRDITERKKAEQKIIESERLYHELFDNSPSSIILFNLDGTILDINSTLELFTGYKRDDLIGKNYSDLSHLVKSENYDALQNKLCISQFGEDIPIIDIELIKKDGSIAIIHPKISLLQIGDEILGLAIFEDITEQEIARKKLEISEDNYKKAFVQANFYKDLFTHDMLNILNNIKSSFQIYTYYKKTKDKSEKIEEVMNIINEQVINGIRLIENIRQISSLDETPKQFLQDVNVYLVLENAIDFIYKSYEKKKVIIYGNFSDKNLTVRANNLLLGVFENILINAIKYNKNTPVKIYISMSAEKENDKDFVKIDFIDNGIGINDELKKLIFKEGYKREKHSKGMGFGLTLVKRLINTYDGRIWVEDKIRGDSSQGSKFSILLPRT